jgi:hypothetical protein
MGCLSTMMNNNAISVRNKSAINQGQCMVERITKIDSNNSHKISINKT